MKITTKPETKLWTKRIILYAVIFIGGWFVPEVKDAITPPPPDPKTVALEEERQRLAMHTVHTAVLGVPVLDEFEYDCAMYEYFDRHSGRHLRYPLKFTCGCNDKKQFGLADISLVDLEGKTYIVRHTPISSSHDNLWFMPAEVKAPETPAAVTAPETNGN